ncbi:MAG: hypothetical protein COA96_16695 [SAR86 cluster bacterium]|uniref:Nucleotide-diphospho-sugar transferase domain-containing protein n=1 Tax=SAR86 cluster bacterium TaxID=2030880 RepID=A0A2A5AHL4_9GAMM|nr:MAG: hypothetical protein COA96_16695 [SAR86 cluster bacterium]
MSKANELNIVCTYWGARMKRYASVLSASITEHCPAATQHLRDVPKPDYHRALRPDLMAHARQAESWRDMAMSLPDGPAVFLDADMIVTGDLSDAFRDSPVTMDGVGRVNPNNPIGVTARAARFRFNAGALYAHLNGKSRQFINDWHNDTQHALHGDTDRLDRMIRDWASVDQAALASLALGNSGVVELPCAKYNSVDQTWNDINDDTRVVHLKGKLRQTIDTIDTVGIPVNERKCLIEQNLKPNVQHVVDHWHALARGIDEKNNKGGAAA